MTDPLVRVVVEQAGRQRLMLLLEDELILGRDCEGVLIADSQVSRRHLRLAVGTNGHVEVADLGSTNGTYLNSIPMKDPELVGSDTRIMIGDTIVRLEFPVAAAGEGAAAGGIGRGTMIRSVADFRHTSIDLVADLVSSAIHDVSDELADGRTITIVFSDIESSTERAVAMGDVDWFDLLEEHNRIFRSELKRCGGNEVKSIGDGFMLTFDSVRSALRFTAAVQRRVEAPDGPDLRVRMGIHTGEAISDRDGDLFGRHVNLAARVANLAVGGQVVASRVTKEIAEGRDDVVFGEPAEVELKGFAQLHTVYDVRWQEGTIE